MADDDNQSPALDPQEALRMLDEARSRLRTVIWALHGMHQDLSALTVDDLADIEHLLTEILDNAMTPSYDAISHVLGEQSGGAVTTH
ncbi:MAG: hypothetical protein H6Q33_918 [Deltaproteobacteria bacterium]|nr:hypothetical protein [Deltaproteobacteria bacterium]